MTKPYAKRTGNTTGYAHHQPYNLARDQPRSRKGLTHTERMVRGAFLGAYQSLADALRSPEFRANFDPAHDPNAGPLLQRYIADANRRALEAFERILVPVGREGAVAGKRQVDGWLRRARGRFAKDAGSALAGNYALRDLLAEQQRATVSPLYPGSYPKQVPPRRRLLRVPKPKIVVQPATGGRDAFTGAPRTQIEALESLPLDLVTMISESQKGAILDILSTGITFGYDGDILAMQIANVVGLFPRWQQAVQNLEGRMVAQKRPRKEIDYRVARYSDWLRERRGIMIARTEVMTAMNTGRINGWYQQADMGFLDPATSIKEWLAAPGACPVCQAMNGRTVIGIETEFDTDAVMAELGMAGKGFGKVKSPPCHPHDRCVVLIHPVRSPDQWLSDEPRPEGSQI